MWPRGPTRPVLRGLVAPTDQPTAKAQGYLLQAGVQCVSEAGSAPCGGSPRWTGCRAQYSASGLERMSVVRLSPRQLECVRLLATGCTSAMIAERLKLSTHTVYQYVAEACARLNVRNRTQLVAEAIRLGVV